MPRIILKCYYIKHEKAHLAHLVRYIATREGTEKARNTHEHLPPTARQKQLAAELVQMFQELRETYEYQDYQANPTMGNASAFISVCIEQNMDLIAKKENYVDYIANRPGAETVGTHGLFTDAGVPVMLSKVQKEVAGHEGPVWTFVLSIRREDAGRLGYDSVKSWEALLRSKRMQMAEAMKIPPEELVWYAAFHNEGHHPHIHIIAYSRDPGKGYVTQKGIEQMRAVYAKEIFKQDMYELYQAQTLQRNELVQASEDTLKTLYKKIEDAWEGGDNLEQLLLQLAVSLRRTKGKKVYGYLPPRVKQQVNRIVDELAMNPIVAECYQKWYDFRLEILHTYSDQMPKPPPLSKQKEFKQIKNIIIRVAMELEPAGTWSLEQQMDDMGRTIVKDMESEADGSELAEGAMTEEDILYEIESIEDGDAVQSAGLVNPNVAYKLGTMFYKDQAIEKNLGASIYWLNHSAGHGNQNAQYLLGKIYLFEPMVREVKSGMFWLQKSMSQGNPYAAYLLAHKDEWGRVQLQSGIIRLFHHLSGIFNEHIKEDQSRNMEWIDHKRRQKLKAKKMAQGIRG